MSARARPFLGLLVLAAVVAQPALGQSRIRTEADTTLITVGDRVALTVTVEHPAASRVAWPDSLSLAPFEVLGATAAPPRSEDGRTLSALTLSVTAFELGEVEIPSFEVAVVDPDGEVEVLATDRFGIEVVTVGADETGDIREIRGPLSIALGPLVVFGPFLLLVLLGGLAYLAYRRMQAGGRTEAPERTAPPRPAHELALEALAELEASPLVERGQVKEYHIRVSEILRLYVERRFRVDALEMTSAEVLDGLRAAGVDPDIHDELARFLRQCDLVKFAKVRPEAERCHETLRLGRWLVERTIPTVVIPDVDIAESGDPDQAAERVASAAEVE